MPRFLLACALASAAAADPVVVHSLPAVETLREAGRLHGQRAREGIFAFQRTAEIARLLNFTRTPAGLAALEPLRRRALEAVPLLGEELAGVAEGAGAALDDVWAVNLISELEALQPEGFLGRRLSFQGDGHCSDVMGRDEKGEVWHGHTEDWSMDFKPLLYIVVYNALPGASFRPFGGLVYPGQAPGFAPSFTPALWSTSNSLFPKGVNASGTATIAVARAALEEAGDDAAAFAGRYNITGQSYGMNMQVVANAPGGAFAAVVESAGFANKVYFKTVGENHTHFNNYKFLDVEALVQESSVHRQAAADRHAAPRSKEDILQILGDTSDPQLPIYRHNHTMFAMVFHSGTGRFWVWHGSNPKDAEPDLTSSLSELFVASAGGPVPVFY